MTVQNTYLDFLKTEGFLPNIDTDGDIYFKYQGKIIIISVNEKDPLYYRMWMPKFWEIENDDERNKAYRAANDANHKLKVAKIAVTHNYVHAFVELFLGDTSDINLIFDRSIAALMGLVDTFCENMRKSEFNLLSPTHLN